MIQIHYGKGMFFSKGLYALNGSRSLLVDFYFPMQGIGRGITYKFDEVGARRPNRPITYRPLPYSRSPEDPEKLKTAIAEGQAYLVGDEPGFFLDSATSDHLCYSTQTLKSRVRTRTAVGIIRTESWSGIRAVGSLGETDYYPTKAVVVLPRPRSLGVWYDDSSLGEVYERGQAHFEPILPHQVTGDQGNLLPRKRILGLSPDGSSVYTQGDELRTIWFTPRGYAVSVAYKLVPEAVGEWEVSDFEINPSGNLLAVATRRVLSQDGGRFPTAPSVLRLYTINESLGVIEPKCVFDVPAHFVSFSPDGCVVHTWGRDTTGENVLSIMDLD